MVKQSRQSVCLYKYLLGGGDTHTGTHCLCFCAASATPCHYMRQSLT